MFNKSTRSYLFRELVYNSFAEKGRYGALSWREARLMFKGATVAAMLHPNQMKTCEYCGMKAKPGLDARCPHCGKPMSNPETRKRPMTMPVASRECATPN